eukprot:713970-Amphidinium_carterae.1
MAFGVDFGFRLCCGTTQQCSPPLPQEGGLKHISGAGSVLAPRCCRKSLFRIMQSYLTQSQKRIVITKSFFQFLLFQDDLNCCLCPIFQLAGTIWGGAHHTASAVKIRSKHTRQN